MEREGGRRSRMIHSIYEVSRQASLYIKGVWEIRMYAPQIP